MHHHHGSNLLRDRRGATAVTFAVILLPLFAFAGLGIDVGISFTLKRQFQSAVDSAALSGAMELASGKGVAGGPATTDIQNLVKYAAMNNMTASAASSLAVATNCTSPSANQICVNNPPLLGNNQTDQFVEAILGEPGLNIFQGLVGYTDAVLIRTRAVAGLKTVDTCMVALNTSGRDLTNSGTANITLSNCAFTSNSTSNDSIRFNGGVTMSAGAISTAGGDVINGTSNSISPPVTTNAPAVTDPYAGRITFSLTGLTSQGCASNTGTNQVLKPTTGNAVLYGGSCTGGSTPPMKFTGGTTVLCPGLYILDGESNQGNALLISGNTTTVRKGTAADGCVANSFDGVTIIATCSTGPRCGGGFSIGGTGSNTPTVTLNAPTSAQTGTSPQYSIPSDVLLYQDPAHADTSNGNNNGNSTIAGGSAVSLFGVIYTPATQLGLNGNATFNNCTELIAGSFSIAGTPNLVRPTGCGVRTQTAVRIAIVE